MKLSSIIEVGILYSTAALAASVGPIELGKTPFPDWLTRFTGLTEWPGLNPPYIPLDFIDFSAIPGYPSHSQGECHLTPPNACSFDCHNCVAHDDVHTCRKLSQTFDDGPTLVTPRLLDRLHHRSTFFCLGINTVNHPNIYRRIMQEGHLIGSHTWSHAFLPSLTNEQIIAQLEWSIWAMNATGRHIPKWFRPPYGGIDERVRAISRQFGMQAVVWDHDTFDWRLSANDPARTEEAVYADVMRWKVANAGGIILEHDATDRTVDVAINVLDIIGDDQLTAAQCIGGINYIKEY